MTDVDSRLLQVQLPAPPTSPSIDLILTWCKNLYRALKADRDRQEALVPFRTAELVYAATFAYTGNMGNILSIPVTGNMTINGSLFTPGPVYFILANDASARTITFGTNILAGGNLVGTINKTAIVEFISDGTTLYEVARKTGL